MSDSRERFFKWAYDQQERPQDHTEWALEIWAAAEAETARACVDHINGHSTVGDRSEQMIAGIKAEFPEAFK